MLEYNHIGIPTNIKRDNEFYLRLFKMFVSGCEGIIYRIEWMRFEEDCPLPEIVKTVLNVAFEVDDLGNALKGKNIIIEPNSPSSGVIVVFIEDNGAPVELMQYLVRQCI
jgi:hypothetical protein